jgi:tetratricopeptide (TPR) repeat protein
MKDIYQAGINSYKEQDFAQAIIYLKRSLEHQDPYTRKYYYAEANAMLGVIYQFNLIDKKLAYQYYKAALAIDPKTETARKHIGEVSGVKIVPKKAKKAVKHKAKHKSKKPAKKKKKKVRKTNEDF